MAALHIIIEDIDDPEALRVALSGDGGDSSPALAIEHLIQGLGDEFIGAQFVEVEINGTRAWLD